MVKQFNIKEEKSKVKPLSLRKNFSWTFLGNIIYAGTQWGMLVVLAKLGSPEMVGVYSLALAIVSPVMMLTNLQLRGIQATDTKNLYLFGDYLGLRLITSIPALIIVLLILIYSHYPSNTVIIIIIMLLAKVIESISDVVFGLLQRNEIMNKISISMILKGVISLISFGFIIWISNSLILGVLSLAIVWFFILVFFDIKNVTYFSTFKPIFDLSKMKNLVKLSLPLGIVLMLGSFNTNLPRYFLEFYIDEEALGYFAAMSYLILAGNTVIGALGQSATPRLANYYANDEKKMFSKLISQMMVIGAIIGIAGIIISILFGKELLTIIYTEEYGKNTDVFVLIMIAAALNYTGSFLGYGMTAARTFKIQPVLGVIWVITSLVASLYLIPNYGLTGAAYVLIISACIQLITKLLVLFYLLRK